jgi:hypothetical protein
MIAGAGRQGDLKFSVAKYGPGKCHRGTLIRESAAVTLY